MFFFYDIIFIFFAIIYFSYTIVKGKWHSGFLVRLGFFPKALKQGLSPLPGRKNIWVHAVSVGEVLAVAGLIKKIKTNFPQHRIILSTVTRTGYRLANSKVEKDDMVIYAPLDFSLIVRQYIRCIG